jgi:hypothetical protein
MMETAEKVPALFSHCVTVYDTMLAQSTRQDIEGVPTMVWEGFLTDLIQRELKFSSPYYSSIMQALQAMGCVRQLRRGGNSSPSQWQLNCDPTVEAFAEQAKSTIAPKYDPMDAVQQQLRDLQRRVERLEELTGISGLPLPRSTTPPGGISVERVE